MTGPLIVELRTAPGGGRIQRLGLNRPERLNALDRSLTAQLADTLEQAGTTPDLRVVIVDGGSSFCSGVDLREALQVGVSEAEASLRIDDFHRVIRAIVAAPQPIIASVDGAAVGFGADLALACDLRVLSERAYLQEKFVDIGLMPDGGGSFHLPRLVGIGRALELLLLGQRIDADQALTLGLANRVVPPDDLANQTWALAEQLASKPPLALKAIKHAVRHNLDASLSESLNREKTGQLQLTQSEDFRAGVTAWRAGTRTTFKGR